MILHDINTTVLGSSATLTLMSFEEADQLKWKMVFDNWKTLKLAMREYKAREPNFPEGLSEVAFCIWSGSSRVISGRGVSSISFDTFNVNTQKAEQIKACSVDIDLTSFGPRSRWDDLYFLDFYNRGNVDGFFDVYKIPNDLIYNFQINNRETFREQQARGIRPRLSIKRDIITTNSILPLASSVKVW